MTDFLVIYGTTDGQTAKIANALAKDLRSLGATADVFNAASSSPSPAGYRAVVVAGSVHAGGYQSEVARWLAQYRDHLVARPTAFVSVCLGVLQHDPAVDAELEAIMMRFFEKTRWTPTIKKVVAGALPYTRYNLFKRWMMRRIVRKAGGDTDMTRDYEYTDWSDLAAFAQTLIELAAGQRVIVECPVPRPERPATLERGA
jgi:menaquinone-dependent protoporphyrinogen oxidase